MAFPLWHWYSRDTALYTYILVNFIITLPFAAFNTYVVFQLQISGFLIGTDADGLPCQTYCIVNWAGSQMDVNSAILYMNAFGFALGGALTLLLSAYADFWSFKHLIVASLVVCFGALATPVYWLQEPTQRNFDSLTALWILFAIVTLISMALLNIYIPYCMRQQSDLLEGGLHDKEGNRRRYGFKMSSFGMIANAVGGILIFIVVIILTQSLAADAAQSSGLLVTTITGFITVAGSIVAILGLPAIPTKQSDRQGWYQPLIEFFRPMKDFLTHKNMAALLISYTIYTDSIFALSSVTGQLFVLELQPSTLDVTIYYMAQYLFLFACTTAFWFLRPYLSVKLETWYLIGFALILIVPIWGVIGVAEVPFGFKYKWEYYVQLLILNISGAFVNTTFRVIFAELVPEGSEIRWFGMSLILSCATVWINYVVSAPIQNATHQLRFPLVISLVFLALALVVEVLRNTLSLFKRDLEYWAAETDSPVESVQKPAGDNKFSTHVTTVEIQ